MHRSRVPQRPATSPGVRGQVVAQALQKFVIEEGRSPGLVELMAMVAEAFGPCGPLSPAEGDEIVRATSATPAEVEMAGQDAVKRYWAASELLFHHYPNPLNVGRS